MPHWDHVQKNNYKIILQSRPEGQEEDQNTLFLFVYLIIVV